TVTRFVREVGETDPGSAECVGPGDVTCGFKIGGGLSQRNMQRHAAVRFERRDSLHGHTFFAEVEDHAAGDAVKAGESGRVDLLAKRMTPVGTHILVYGRALPPSVKSWTPGVAS